MNTLPRVGSRIRLLAMHDDPDPLQVGQIGTVVGITRHGSNRDEWFQVEVSWDNGRTLMLSSPPDVFEIIGGGK